MVPHITKEELWKKIQREEDFLLIDVLAPESYQQFHLPGAINAPLEELEEVAKKWKKNQEIVVYCGSYT